MIGLHSGTAPEDLLDEQSSVEKPADPMVLGLKLLARTLEGLLNGQWRRPGESGPPPLR
jgi:hypothetical protein